ncbi:citramalate synthase [Mesorhizobium sp. M7A.F.Ca.US.014.04.1.1]|uniref:Citramalate synthase n=4 Tax=Phyllobacteriaceae TaxID=69277 RepID=E8TLM5_MESCW|nr:2-isopropylmalate synthase/homocitrate synthase family protein [Mesorhizobium ciceri biovar biserrulae WSM1271]AMX92177.1 citramalate synthase [Mesorhizobium ciceri]RUU16179.1 citramalate synthase [Mesorhizobium sp. Primo-B]RUU36089.1 citramalate synthase [Mesorhizobium sp. Primo-A]RUX37295.1 citramalate synthase [Mesorhizobium sp. M7A.F.Ca.CA.002.11.2.1]RUX55304.1 citramalate synthase [Mesorhizobium sp. M7A.F.Ca.CA.002.12.1.1]RUX64520.1 citramalate synthase [Mesorhizobium sp. M7A.F.Ca.US.
MTRERLYLFDTTLRDGQQTPGIDFSVEDKIAIAKLLDAFGLDYVEGGYPGANPTDTAFFQEKRTERAKFVAFGMTKRAGVSASNDPGLASLVQSKSDAICFVAKSWDYHVRVALGCTNEENLDAIKASVEAAIAAGKEALVDCEHFFDGFKANPDYALACARTAYDAGARWVVLCDTNGGTQPSEVRAIVEKVILSGISGDHLGIHAHDDTGQAVANSLAAVEAGVRQIQGTLNGIGERCGNANLISIVPTLALKPAFADRFETGISAEALTGISRLSRAFDELLNRAPEAQAPYVGASAFATKAGIHASALAKEPATYEHVPPETVGNRRRVMVSDQGGKANFLAELRRRGIEVPKDDHRLDALISVVKEREAEGYAYEGADASFELLARKMLHGLPEFFNVTSFRCMVERRFDANGQLKTVSEAIVKVVVDGEEKMSVAEGHGPVNALDIALRKDLGKFQGEIADMELADFKVRILNGGTEAITRVLIESHDGTGARWWTVGVSENIIDASFQALMDSIVYKLMKNREMAGLVAAE